MDRLFCMRVFVRVVEHGSFAKAADALGISRASATAAIASLEKQLGVRLLNRTTRKVSVTEEGDCYYHNCVRILGEIAEVEDDLSGTRLEPRGRLRITIPQSFMDMVFYPALARFQKQYPQLDLEVLLTDRAVNLVEEGVDCAIRGIELAPDSGLVAKTLAITRWLTCASPAYLEEFGTPQSVEDLANHNCIRFISQSTGRPRDWVFNCGGEQKTFMPNGRLRLTSYHANTMTAIEGAGIAQLPDGLGVTAVLAGKLKPILTESVGRGPSLLLVYPGNRYLSARARVFIDFMSNAFPREGWWDQILATMQGRNL